MNKRQFFGLSVVIGIVLFSVIVWKSDIFAIITIFRNISFPKLALYLFVSLGILSLLVLRWQLILRVEGHDVPFTKLFLYKLSGYSVSYIMPTMHVGGSPVRALLLQKQNISIEKGACSVILDESLEFSADLIIAAIGFFVILFEYAIPLSAIILMSIIILFALLILTRFFFLNFRGTGSFSSTIRFFSLDKIDFIRKIKSSIKRIEFHIIDFLKNHREEFFISSFISIGLWFLMFVEYDLALSLFGYHAQIQEIFLILAFVALAYLVPIPAALGVLEAAQISVFTILGLNVSLAIALSLLIRGRDLLWTFIGIVYASHEGLDLLKIENKNEDKNEIESKEFQNTAKSKSEIKSENKNKIERKSKFVKVIRKSSKKEDR